MQPEPPDTARAGYCRCCTLLLYMAAGVSCGLEYTAADLGALGGTRTPNLLIRSYRREPRYTRSAQVSGCVHVPLKALEIPPGTRLLLYLPAVQSQAAATVSAPTAAGAGMGSPCRRSPSRWNFTASRIRSRHSS